MEIGKPKRTITVEPLQDPVPRERPLRAPERSPGQPTRRRVQTRAQ